MEQSTLHICAVTYSPNGERSVYSASQTNTQQWNFSACCSATKRKFLFQINFENICLRYLNLLATIPEKLPLVPEKEQTEPAVHAVHVVPSDTTRKPAYRVI